MRKLILIMIIACTCIYAAEPELYKDAWLGIEYYNAEDIYSYRGKDANLLEYKKMLRNHKAKKGIFILNQLSKRSYKLIVVTELGGKKISSHRDFIKWAKKAEGDKKKETYTYRWIEYYAKSDGHAFFDTPPKPNGYVPGEPLQAEKAAP